MHRTFVFYALAIITFLFLSTNVQNISANNQEIIENNIDEVYEVEYNSHAASTETSYEKALNGLGITLHPGTSFSENSTSSERSLNHCQSLVYKALMSLPEKHRSQLKNLTLYFAEGRRGLGGGSTIILRCSNVTDKELMSVLVHEIGHTVDTGLISGTMWAGKSEFMDGNNPVYKNDLSVHFYRISWKDESTQKKGVTKQDFVTGYAMSDPFEDFAESYNYYLLHGKQFKEMAQENTSLLRKYLYIKYFVFKGEEFDNDPYNSVNHQTRVYDSTVLNYNDSTFLKS